MSVFHCVMSQKIFLLFDDEKPEYLFIFCVSKLFNNLTSTFNSCTTSYQSNKTASHYTNYNNNTKEAKIQSAKSLYSYSVFQNCQIILKALWTVVQLVIKAIKYHLIVYITTQNRDKPVYFYILPCYVSQKVLTFQWKEATILRPKGSFKILQQLY
jgi:hypothetical protein